jgi:MraZ protein
MWRSVEERGAQVADLVGTHHYQMDPKGRISLPAKYRESFEDGVFLTLGQDGCLYAFPRSEWDRKKAEMRERDFSDQASRAFTRMFFANAAEAELDSQGRLTLPRNLRDTAHLGKEITVTGVSDHAEIWSAEAWEQYSRTHGASYTSGALAPG